MNLPLYLKAVIQSFLYSIYVIKCFSIAFIKELFELFLKLGMILTKKRKKKPKQIKYGFYHRNFVASIAE